MATEEEITILKRRRGGLKAKLTLFKTFVEQIKNKPSLNDVDLIELNQRITRIDPLLEDFDRVQGALEFAVDNDAEQFAERELFESSFFTVTSIAKDLVSKAMASINSAENNVAADNGSVISSVANSQLGNPILHNPVKLPIISLPNFGGDYETWLEFRDTFESLIHQNNSIGEIQKFHYLRASLQGGAAEVVRSLEFSSSNYKLAWKTLCDRYDNIRLLVHNHVSSLFALESIKKESSADIRNLIDTVSKNLSALSKLKQPTDQWDTLIIYIVSMKLDNITSREWEQHKCAKELPTWSDFKEFLKGRADLLETLEHNRERNFKQNYSSNQKNANGLSKCNRASSNVKGLLTSNIRCALCKGEHTISNCEEFLKMAVNDRVEKVKSIRLCLNCLKKNHYSKFCRLGHCKKCDKKHNVLLHVDSQVPEPVNDSQTALTAMHSKNYVLLSTAHIKVLDFKGNAHIVRAILDSGSQSNFVTRNLSEKLNLKREEIKMSVSGLSQNVLKLTHKCEMEIHSVHNDFHTKISCLILPEITGYIPSIRIDTTEIKIPKNIVLADPTYYKPGKIDVLIGADLFYNLLCADQINLGANGPVLQNTRFGWIISGPVENIKRNNKLCCNLSTLDIQQQLARFWEIEECPAKKSLSKEENDCEIHFQQNVKRLSNGRFMVSLPFKDSVESLGESFDQAKRRFLALERKFLKNIKFKQMYVDFMREYLTLGHMSEVDISDKNEIAYYMPHHGVLRELSVTTKLRVVFDASAPTTSGVSLNDIQMVGCTLQSDLLSLLLRFRQYRYVVSADIAKMYRMVMIEPTQRPLQRILWRENPSEPIKVYNLNTVTYGHAAAPFLSIRCLFELANECENSMPDIAEIIRDCFYVDDFLGGSDSIEHASYIAEKVSNVLKSGCFDLRKWFSNEPKILEGFDKSTDPFNILTFGENENTKTLGLTWSCQSDYLTYQINEVEKGEPVTKRMILSHTAQIFDPLGLLSPCTIISKINLQNLWREKISWDDRVPINMERAWSEFRSELQVLNNLKISRHVMCINPIITELHGFSDSSNHAYGGCIYVRTVDDIGNVTVKLLCAKSKVSPVRVISIPRLELCGALVLARLSDKVLRSLKTNFSRCLFWSDSSIVLGWLRMPSSSLKTFIGNRVSEIQSLTESHEWRHVPTTQNPADMLSRGVMPKQLCDNELWWHGPEWLSMTEEFWPKSEITVEGLPEIKSNLKGLMATNTFSLFLFDRYSNLNKLKRVTAYLLRFKNKKKGPLTLLEVTDAEKCLIKLSQKGSFPVEYERLLSKKSVGTKSRILSLNPFMDIDGIIRVGGRLENSNFEFSKKHPILVSAKHAFTKLIVRNEHIRLMHAGPQQLLASIRERFWPTQGRSIARATVRQCVKCHRFNAPAVQPIMGNLPKPRLEFGHVFDEVGVDYAGPFQIRDRKGRGYKVSKCYISLFVCFSTKAVHLELVTDLTSEAFILTLRRFVARRGAPRHIYSDNGTCFVGATKELKELGKYLLKNCNELETLYTRENIQWHFIPANSPHFGGLWEAGVKSTKYHLKRVAGNACLTFEQFYSLLVQIESILNSRPLYPLSSDPNDLNPLTPAHFLVGKSLTDVPDPVLSHVPENRLSQYQKIQQLRQHFWNRWSKEYIGELQQRVKWQTHYNQLGEGDMVLIKEDNLPPLRWRLGRIINVFPGKDNINRVATVKTASGELKRAFSKICPLPKTV